MASKKASNGRPSKSAPAAVISRLKKDEYLSTRKLSFLIQPVVVGVVDMKFGPRALAWGLKGEWMAGVDFEDGKPYGPLCLVAFCGDGAERARRRFVGHVLRNGTVWRKRLPMIYEAIEESSHNPEPQKRRSLNRKARRGFPA